MKLNQLLVHTARRERRLHRLRPAHHEQRAQAGVVERALPARQAVAVIAPEEHHRAVGQSIFLELAQQRADLAVHLRDVVVPLREPLAHLRRVGVVRRHHDLRRIGDRLASLEDGREHHRLVRGHDVEHREERLALVGAVAPVRLVAQLVPDRERAAELVVGLDVVRRVVARRAEILGERLHIEGRHRLVRARQIGDGVLAGAHVLRADRVLPHPRDDRRPARRADGRGGEGVGEPYPFARELIERRRARDLVAVRADPRAQILRRDPEDVRMTNRRGRRSLRPRRCGVTNDAAASARASETEHAPRGDSLLIGTLPPKAQTPGQTSSESSGQSQMTLTRLL